MSRSNGLRLPNLSREHLRDIPLHILHLFTIEFANNGLYSARHNNRNGSSYIKLETSGVRAEDLRETASTVQELVEGYGSGDIERDDRGFHTYISLKGPLNPHDAVVKYTERFGEVSIEVL